MAGYKRKSYTNKRPTGARRAPVKRTYKKRSTYTPSDGITQYVSTYFEVSATQPDDTDLAKGGNVGYSIKCDPLDAKVLGAITANTGGTLEGKLNDSDNVTMGDDSALAFPRLTTLAGMYRQYRINSVNIKVTTDRGCGLDNPLLMLTDKGDAAAVAKVGDVMKQAHKSKILTESDRTMSYGWKPTTAQDREFNMIHQKINNNDAHFLKILQEIEPHINGNCKHRIELGMSVTLKDSKN